MGYCVWGLSFLACGTPNIFNFFLDIFLPDEVPTLLFYLISLVLSSVVIYLLAKMLGRIGGMLLMVLGVLGSLFTAGISLVLTLIGFILTFLGGAAMLVIIINVISYLLCIACYVI